MKRVDKSSRLGQSSITESDQTSSPKNNEIKDKQMKSSNQTQEMSTRLRLNMQILQNIRQLTLNKLYAIDSNVIAAGLTLMTCLYSAEALAAAAEFTVINEAADGLKTLAKDKVVPLIELLMVGGSGVASAKMSTWWPVIAGCGGVGLFHYVAGTIAG